MSNNRTTDLRIFKGASAVWLAWVLWHAVCDGNFTLRVNDMDFKEAAIVTGKRAAGWARAMALEIHDALALHGVPTHPRKY